MIDFWTSHWYFVLPLENRMKKFVTWNLLVNFLLASCMVTLAKKKDHDESAPTSRFPAAYTKVVKGGNRFEQPAYFGLMASDGIRKVDAKILYARLQAAVAANERYKALY